MIVNAAILSTLLPMLAQAHHIHQARAGAPSKNGTDIVMIEMTTSSKGADTTKPQLALEVPTDGRWYCANGLRCLNRGNTDRFDPTDITNGKSLCATEKISKVQVLGRVPCILHTPDAKEKTISLPTSTDRTSMTLEPPVTIHMACCGAGCSIEGESGGSGDSNSTEPTGGSSKRTIEARRRKVKAVGNPRFRNGTHIGTPDTMTMGITMNGTMGVC